ncbi:MAG: hypothetical protein EXX96DRAFT_82787 [Benjaminiella poitrasii]|nr:MAG: hypothetical protein EXX96DRAFT_82787 [Benjaminiella poitrasii]
MFIHYAFAFLCLFLTINKAEIINKIARDQTGSNGEQSFTYLGDTPYQNQKSTSSSIMTALRVQRDIAMNITIDQLIWPSLELSTVFFGKDYSVQQLSKVENVLRMGYKRLVVDIYWDPSRYDWQLCPLDLKTNNSDTSIDISLPDGYVCSSNSKLSHFLEVVSDYLTSTETGKTSKSTDIVFLILNLHELDSSATTINNSNRSTIDMHDSNLSKIIHDSISPYSSSSVQMSRIYTPLNLSDDRVSLFTSSYNDNLSYSQQANNTTDNIWPQWLYLIENKVQLMVGFGTLPSGPTSFHLSSEDNNTIFDAQALNGIMNMTVETQCPSTASWSFISDRETPFTYASALNVTECNYSPYFTYGNYSSNHSIYSADDSGHLEDNVLSTIWSWAVNEPSDNYDLRCAAISKETGRWAASDCTSQYRTACRHSHNLNIWILTDDVNNYEHSLTGCPDGYIFDVPRIPRQNTLLKRTIENSNVTEDNVWINLNLAYNVDKCWVVGRYGTCWWSDDDGQEFIGLIRTSIVGGVIILTLVGIFTWVKCARIWRNRNSKSRKAMVKAMLTKREYVTVPA